MDNGSYRRLSAGAYDSSDDEGGVLLSRGSDPEPRVTAAVAKYRTYVCAAVMVALLADYLLLTIIIPIMPVLLPPATHSTFQMGILFAAQPAMQFLIGPIIGLVVDKTGSGRGVMFLGCIVAAGATGLFIVGGSFWELVAARAVQGIGSTATMVGGMAYVNRIHPSDKRGGASGTAMAGVALGVVFGPALGGGLYTWGGRDAPFFLVIAMLCVAALVQVALYVRAKSLGSSLPTYKPDEGDDAGSCGSQLKVFSDPYVFVLAMAVMATNAAEAMIEPVIPRYLKVTYGMSPGSAGLVFSAVPFAYLVATPLAGCLGDKVRKWKLVFAGMLFMAVGMPIMWVVSEVLDKRYSDISRTGGLAGIIVALAFAGAGLAFVDAPSMPLVTEIMDWRGRTTYGSAVATVNMSVNLGFIIGPLGGSALAEVLGTAGAMACFAALALVVTPLVITMKVVGTRRRYYSSGSRLPSSNTRNTEHSNISLALSPAPDTRAV